jgi:amino acid transporter
MKASDPRTERAIGPVQLLALGVNGIVGVGIFFAPASVAANAPGLGAVAVFVLTGVVLVPAALTLARLGARFAEDGGPVVFARAAFGDRTSFLVGWLAYVSAVFSTSAVAVGLTRAVLPALGLGTGVLARAAPALLVTLLAAVVASGLRLSARLWTGLTALKLAPLLLLAIAFLLAAPSLPAPAATTPDARWLRGALTAVFACQGFEIVPVVAGQARASSRAVPLATLSSLLLAVGLYAVLMLSCVMALPALATSAAPLAETAGVLGGGRLARLVAAGTSVSALGITFGMMVTTPRYLSALAAGGRSLFRLERQSAKGVPLRALAVTWAAVAVVVSLGDLGALFALSSIAVLAQFGTSALALARLAARRERGLSPRDAWPALPTLGVALLLVAFGASLNEALLALATTAAGVVLLRVARPRAPASPR